MEKISLNYQHSVWENDRLQTLLPLLSKMVDILHKFLFGRTLYKTIIDTALSVKFDSRTVNLFMVKAQN